MNSNIKEDLTITAQEEKLLNAKKKYEMKCIKTFIFIFVFSLIIGNIVVSPFFLSDGNLKLNEIMQVECVMFAMSFFPTFNLTAKPFTYYKYEFDKEVEQIKNMQM